MVPLSKKLACNWRSLDYSQVVARIHEWAFWITERVYTNVPTGMHVRTIVRSRNTYGTR